MTKKFAKHIALLLVLLLSVKSGHTQPPCFDADDTVGCVPFTVTLTSCADPSKPDAYDYGDGSALSFDTVHTYNSPGIYTVTQYIDNGGGNLDTLIRTDYIRAVGTPVPQFEAYACAGSIASISITDSNYDRFILDYGDGSPNDTVLPSTTTLKNYIDSLPKTITVTGIYDGAPCSNSASLNLTLYNSLQKPDIHSLTTQNGSSNDSLLLGVSGYTYLNYLLSSSSYPAAYSTIDTFAFFNPDSTINFFPVNSSSDEMCYTITNFDVCGNSVAGDSLCSTNLSVTANNEQNELIWNSYKGPGLLEYRVYRDNTLLATISSDTTFIDTSVTCSQQYCYRVESTTNLLDQSGANLVSISNTQCVTAISTDTPPELTEFNSTFENGAIRLFWEAPTSSVLTYEISRSSNASPFNLILNQYLPDTNYIDNSFITTEPQCYRISYYDSCGNYSNQLSIPETCPIHLSMTESATQNTLTWTAYTGFSTSVQEYIIEWLDQNGNVLSSISNGTSTSYIDNNIDTASGTITYRILAIANSPLGLTSQSNTVQNNQSISIFFPNAFTPNGDGTNDIFKGVGAFIAKIEFTVLNSWGEVLYYTENYNEGWNGRTPQGEIAPEGTYVYIADVTDYEGNQTTYRGTFYLMH